MEGLQNRSARYEYRHTNSSIISRKVLLLTQHKDSDESPDPPDSHTDRNAAIALSILIFAILMAIAWYSRLHSCAKRRIDLEMQQCQERFANTGSWSREAGNVWYRRTSSNATEVTRSGSRKNSIFKLKPLVTRKDSVATSSSHGSPGTEEKRKWPSLSHWRTQDSAAPTLASDIASVLSQPQAEALPISSLHAMTVPLTSTERPSPTHSRRSSAYRKNSVPDPLSVSNPAPPLRRSSLTQTSYDKQWWDEVARRGSTSSTTRRLSVLEPVLEPEMRGYEHKKKSMSNVTKDGTGEDVTGNTRQASKDEGGEEVGCDRSWKGSKCEEVVMYDWTRPSDAEIQRASEITYTKVDWKKERERARRASIQPPVIGRRVDPDECIQEMDFALGW